MMRTLLNYYRRTRMPGWIHGTYPVVPTAYASTYGSGDRTGIITVTDSGGIVAGGSWSIWINGNTADSGLYVNGVACAGRWIKFNFAGVLVVIDEAKTHQSGGHSHGVWRWQGSNDDANWTNIGDTFTLGGATTATHTTLVGNTFAFSYYRLLGISGSTNGSPYWYEIEFQAAVR